MLQLFAVCMLIKGAMAACTPPCRNGGRCVRDICLCRANYTGSRCEYDMTRNNACVSAPCQHGGTCVSWASDYLCDCPKGYIGTQCEYSDSWYSNTAPTHAKSTDSYNPLGVLLGVVLSLVAVAALMGGISWWKITRRRQLRHPMGRPRHRLAANHSRRDSGLVLRLGSVSSCVEAAGYGGLQQPTGSGAGDGQHWADCGPMCGPMCGPYDPAMVDLPPAYSLVVNKPNYLPDPPPSYEESVVAVAAATTEDVPNSTRQPGFADPQNPPAQDSQPQDPQPQDRQPQDPQPQDPQPQDGNSVNPGPAGSDITS